MSRLRYSVALLWLALLISIAPLQVAAASTVIKAQALQVTMSFDGVRMQPPAGQYVFIYNNSTYVPLRFITYALKKSVSWDAKNVKVTVAEPDSREMTTIKEYLLNASNRETTTNASKTIALTKVNASYAFKGSVKKIPQGLSSYLQNGTLYVPLRFLSESTGTTINWNQKAKTITALSDAYRLQQLESSQGKEDDSYHTIPSDQTASEQKQTTQPSEALGGTTANKPSYEEITGETEDKLTALQSQAKSVMISLAAEYLNAKDNETKAKILSKGEQQLNSFTSSFNSIVSSAESRLKAYGYDTAIIDEYRSEFESQVQSGLALVRGMEG
ncbi:Copper amine oxidase N-terminal domain-containing protein [Paenibacillus sophorae]|uniref:Copper amine oxidase N-terminal domain-containing protein n=1 Tax=Paenibacillus sophorae TaxID=1333845 RepID=A0A1H8QGL3_9BACL|nr:copper amine oxidase N-terminal domain-containing protein [Paenibacillus sophorae]QWU15129.1 copper amine oxidase N-terminal domain-containing protein [Paenibacillus sophorae]SEO53342.1 Copper amine oxidase N-terminal domain-containing protein [Paenibacillus sophorae]